MQRAEVKVSMFTVQEGCNVQEGCTVHIAGGVDSTVCRGEH